MFQSISFAGGDEEAGWAEGYVGCPGLRAGRGSSLMDTTSK
jgi:hypothetical protein